MSISTIEQYGYNSAYDLMCDLARDISDGGELIAVKAKTPRIESKAYKFDGGYWIITYRCGRLTFIDYFSTINELLYIMEEARHGNN